MAKTYKIWAYIEEYNDKTDKYKDIDEPLAIGKFKKLLDAKDFVQDQHEYYLNDTTVHEIYGKGLMKFFEGKK